MEHKLSSVVLHITDKCENHCPFCYAGATNQKFTHADVTTVHRVIDELSRYQVERVSLLGGDPALHPDVLEFASYLVSHGIKAGIMSNSMKFNADLSKVIECIDLFETTVHGRNAAEHDELCLKPGSYDELMNNLRSLSAFDERAVIGIAINVTPDTADKIFDMAYSLLHVEKIKMNYIVLQRIIPYGRASKSNVSEKYVLNEHNLDSALSAVERVQNELGVEIAVEDPFPLCAIHPRYRKFMHPCEWGFTKASLDWRGNLTRCGADGKHILGNILVTPLADIWENSRELIAFRKKSYLPASCKSCKLFDFCGGGCSLSCSDEADTPDYLMELFGGHPVL